MKCDECGRVYPDIYPETKQGVECSTHVHVMNGVTKLVGSYGSYRWDAHWLVVSPGTHLSPGDVLCDECVAAMVESGGAALEGSAWR